MKKLGKAMKTSEKNIKFKVKLKQVWNIYYYIIQKAKQVYWQNFL